MTRSLSSTRNSFRAISKYVRISPSKLRRILSELPGLTFTESGLLLAFLPYTSCLPIVTLIRSAAANARASDANIKPAELVVTEAFATPGPSLKRIRPAARGRGWRFLRRTAHLTVRLKPLGTASDDVKPSFPFLKPRN